MDMQQMKKRVKGYDEATTNTEPSSNDLNYLHGYKEGLEANLSWAQEELSRFKQKYSMSMLAIADQESKGKS